MWLQGPSVTVRLMRLNVGCNLSSLNMPTHIGVFPRWMSLPLWNLLRGTDPPVTKEGVTVAHGVTGCTHRRLSPLGPRSPDHRERRGTPRGALALTRCGVRG